jgi:hypothetical protein
VGELGPAALRDRVVDDLHQAQPLQVVAHQQQRPHLAAGTPRRRVEPGEAGRELVELSRRLQLVLAAQVGDHPVADLAALPVCLDQPQVHVAAVTAFHRHTLHIHCPYIVGHQSTSRRCDTPNRGPVLSLHGPLGDTSRGRATPAAVHDNR